jgi:preprotein translocase subunit SecG
MEIFLIVLQAFIALAMIGFILLQKSEGGGLVSQQGGQAMNRFMSRRGQADFLTRTTTVLATGFMVLCLIIAIISGQKAKNNSILAQVVAEDTTNSNKSSEQNSKETVSKESTSEVEAPKAFKSGSQTQSQEGEDTRGKDTSVPNIAIAK